MSTNHDAVAALPVTGAPNKTLVRNILVSRMPYVLGDAESPTNLVAVDPSTGTAIVDIAYLGRVFHYDPTDLTTPHDGVTCLVSNEGRRFKLATGTDVAVWAVLSMTPASPPASPAPGDSYLVPAGATGAWSGKGGYVAVKTARGWEFLQFGIGRLLYVEDIDAYYRRNAAGVWTAGLGASALAPDSVTLLNVLGTDASFMLKVENQTTNAPPASPSPPTAYIIGPAPTGAWAGNAGKLAICLASGVFTIVAPAAGDEVYDKSTGNAYRFNGSAWISSAGAWLYFNYVFTSGTGSQADNAVTNYYSYSDGTAPVQSGSVRLLADNVTLARAALKTGALLRFRYSARLVIASSAGSQGAMTVALFRDSISSAIAWKGIPFYTAASGSQGVDVEFNAVVPAPDTSSHTYSVAIFSPAVSSVAQTLSRRNFTIEEAA